MEYVKETHIEQEEILEFVGKCLSLLEKNYIFPEVAEQVSAKLRDKLKKGEFNIPLEKSEFKRLIDRELQSVNNDKHLHIYFQEEDKSDDKDHEELGTEYIRRAEKSNFGFHRIERLPGNIGYLDLRVFYENEIASETAVHVMNALSHTDAMIIDLRKNIGGSTYMVAMIASYFVSRPSHIESFYRRDEDRTSEVWTLPYVPGKRYGDKPVYILTSKKTFSAGELFAYAFKNMGRAEVIGERTEGGANPGYYHQVTKHIQLFIPNGRSISPYTNTNWEGTGVEPDIEVSADNAYSIAYEKALKKVKESFGNQVGYEFLIQEIDEAIDNSKTGALPS